MRISINRHCELMRSNPVQPIINLCNKIARAIKNQITHKERFLHACIYSFYVQKARIDLDGIGFLPFINEQHNRDWAKMKANELIAQFKKEGTINIRYKHALAWANASAGAKSAMR